MADARFDDSLLRRVRNDIPIDWLIEHFRWPFKRRLGQFVFLCPNCQEMRSDVKRDTNLGRCFHCETNYNPIDFMMSVRQCEFRDAVAYLTPFLPPAPSPPTTVTTP
jgi:DNA primase